MSLKTEFDARATCLYNEQVNSARSKMSRLNKTLIFGLLLLAALMLVAPSPRGAQWRIRLVGLKLGGHLPSHSWTSLLLRMRPSSFGHAQFRNLDLATQELLVEGTGVKLKACLVE